MPDKLRSNLFGKLPTPLQTMAQSLDPDYSTDVWPYPAIMEVLPYCRLLNVAILGGDVLTIQNGSIRYTSDSWSVPKYVVTDSWTEYIENSIQRAENYIMGYDPTHRAKAFFAIVIAERAM